MYQIKRIYGKYADEVSRFQYRNFNPISTLNLNEENKKRTFKIDIEDDFIDRGIEYYIEGKITPVDAKNTYTNISNIKIVDNFVTHMSPQLEVKKHRSIIDEIDFAGIASTPKNCNKPAGTRGNRCFINVRSSTKPNIQGVPGGM